MRHSWVLSLLAIAGAPAMAQVPDSELCVGAIASLGAASGIPVGLMGAIGRVESGKVDPRDRTLKAWPWTINAEGRGTLFASKTEALAAVVALQARGVSSIDVGCMQVNLMHHPSTFASLADAFDPATNVRYAASFLRSLHAETGDWNLAAAYYHSRTPDLALAYQQKVLANLPGAGRVQPAITRQTALQTAWAATMQTPGLSGAGSATPVWMPIPGSLARVTRSQTRLVAR